MQVFELPKLKKADPHEHAAGTKQNQLTVRLGLRLGQNAITSDPFTPDLFTHFLCEFDQCLSRGFVVGSAHVVQHDCLGACLV